MLDLFMMPTVECRDGFHVCESNAVKSNYWLGSPPGSCVALVLFPPRISLHILGVTERDGGMEWEYIIFVCQSSWVFQLCECLHKRVCVLHRLLLGC